jgi:hypothetical protein
MPSRIADASASCSQISVQQSLSTMGACQQRQQFGHVRRLLFAGCTFAIELFLGWNVAFVATHNLRKRVVLRRRKIFWFYFWHGSFIFDFISTCVFIAQVKMHW